MFANLQQNSCIPDLRDVDGWLLSRYERRRKCERAVDGRPTSNKTAEYLERCFWLRLACEVGVRLHAMDSALRVNMGAGMGNSPL